MTAPLRRGACPSLGAPMPTGDGWLVRLSAARGAGPGAARGACRRGGAARQRLIEVTARGSLQMRGLAADAAPELAAALDALGIVVAAGLPVLTGPLAGLDPAETADPRPLAAAIRRGRRRRGSRAGCIPRSRSSSMAAVRCRSTT